MQQAVTDLRDQENINKVEKQFFVYDLVISRLAHQCRLGHGVGFSAVSRELFLGPIQRAEDQSNSDAKKRTVSPPSFHTVLKAA